MVRSPALAAERPYLYLDRNERDRSMAEAVKALDARIVPIVRGELEERADWAASGVTLFRLVTAQGVPAVAHLPTSALSPRVRGKLFDLMQAIEDELP